MEDKQRFSIKILHICIVLIIIISIIFIAVLLVLNYEEKGESNMPFILSKIAIISSAQGKDVENSEFKWDIKAILNNDINIYVEKNTKYGKQELISEVKIGNFNIKKAPNIGSIKIYKPINTNNVSLFENNDENIANELIFSGSKSTDLKNLQISNQGGRICFRCANNEIGEYKSNDDMEINYNQLLQKMNIDEANLEAVVSFDIIITLDSGKSFKTEGIEIKIPNKNIVNEGTVGLESTDIENAIFKRIEN